ncbi:PDDEXK nuclease domain-containing protein [Candidatus Palauibacter sp.]|uniref:PDDEXK nuclease domain-containing protein n=1 Tax=Candidatus Palauibacter sp. TaxID=3101350 RepID=UPI003B51B63B
MKKPVPSTGEAARYEAIFGEVSEIVEAARRSAARSVNAAMTAAYWLIGRQIAELEQEGRSRAEYGKETVERLAADLSARYGRGFSVRNVWLMRAFYLAWPIVQTPSAESLLDAIRSRFPLPWSAYVRLLSVQNERARTFYEAEALCGGWTVRQLNRQINSQFYERTALSRNKAALLAEGGEARPGDGILPEEEIKDPFVLEFLDLKDEYSETDLEEALIRHLEAFLLELGGDFCFIARQRRLRIGDEWYRVDLLFFHRRLRCLVVIDLKIGKFTHADAGQMHLYLNYAREHWVRREENPPVGLILCAQKDAAVARYALDGLPNKVMAAEYRTTLPDEELLASEIERTRTMLVAGAPSDAPDGRSSAAEGSASSRALRPMRSETTSKPPQ